MKEFKYDNLIVSDSIKPITSEITLVPGEYQRGAILGLAEGKHGLIGTEGYIETSVNAVLCESVTLSEEKKVMGYINGIFNKNEITLGESAVLDNVLTPARNIQIIIK